jgi:hypothetical protein
LKLAPLADVAENETPAWSPVGPRNTPAALAFAGLPAPQPVPLQVPVVVPKKNAPPDSTLIGAVPLLMDQLWLVKTSEELLKLAVRARKFMVIVGRDALDTISPRLLVACVPKLGDELYSTPVAVFAPTVSPGVSGPYRKCAQLVLLRENVPSASVMVPLDQRPQKMVLVVPGMVALPVTRPDALSVACAPLSQPSFRKEC